LCDAAERIDSSVTTGVDILTIDVFAVLQEWATSEDRHSMHIDVKETTTTTE